MERRIQVYKGSTQAIVGPGLPPTGPEPGIENPIIVVTPAPTYVPEKTIAPLSSDPYSLTTIVPMGNPGLGSGTGTWQFRGNGTLAVDGDLELHEHHTLNSNARKTYALNPTMRKFKFEIHDLVLADNGPELPPDAFEAMLSIASNNATTYVGQITELSRTDSFLNIQRDGSFYAGPGVTVTGTIANNRLDLSKPIVVSVDITNLPDGTQATLGFDLIGFGITDSSVRLQVPEGSDTQNSISGFVYVDANNNGLFDSGEIPIPDVLVSLSGSATRTVFTGSDGSYRFDNLVDGIYTVTQSQAVNYNDGRDTQGTPILGTAENDRFVNLLLESNVAATNYNFGELPQIVPANNSISGFVYRDSDNDGVFDPEEVPIEGVNIHLFGPVTSSFTTRRDGFYSFTDLPDGVYSIVQTQPAGYDDGLDTQGQPVIGSVANDRFNGLAVSGGIKLVRYNFGERTLVAPQPNSIAGAVYLDTNSNGVYDSSEKPLAGVIVQLTGNGIERTFVTDDQGIYRFTDLPDGTYNVSQEQPAGYEDGPETIGTPALGTLENDRFVGLQLIGGIHASGYHFAERYFSTGTSFIAGWVYIDRNRNGRRDSGEPGLKQVEMRLSGPVSRTVYTNSIGQYVFTDLPAGSYTLTQAQPFPYHSGVTQVGTTGGLLVGDAVASIKLNGSTGGKDYNFAEHPKPDPSWNSIGGVVYLDANGNGKRDPGERVIPGVTINLAGPVQRSMTTGNDGTYAFIDLPDGVYSLSQIHPSAFIDGAESRGVPVLGLATDDLFEQVLLGNNTIAIEYNFGESGLQDPSRLSELTAPSPSEAELLERMRRDGERWKPSTDAHSLGYNHHYALDADNDGNISPLDVLVIINCINRDGMRLGIGRVIAGSTVDDNMYLDVDGDRLLSPLDVLVVINAINSGIPFQVPPDSGEGEGSSGLVGEGEGVSSRGIPPGYGWSTFASRGFDDLGFADRVVIERVYAPAQQHAIPTEPGRIPRPITATRIDKAWIDLEKEFDKAEEISFEEMNLDDIFANELDESILDALTTKYQRK
jgi:hypothetical protein